MLTVPSMHAIYISRFSFSIAISRRHIIKSRLACNIKRMDLSSSGSTYDNIFLSLVYFWFFLDNHTLSGFFSPCLYPLPTSFLFSSPVSIFNTITSLIFPRILQRSHTAYYRSPFFFGWGGLSILKIFLHIIEVWFSWRFILHIPLHLNYFFLDFKTGAAKTFFNAHSHTDFFLKWSWNHWQHDPDGVWCQCSHQILT